MANAKFNVPYASASSGAAARDEIVALLRRFQCESVGFMDDFTQYTLLLQFTHRGRLIQIKASAKGWAALFLKHNPWTPKHRSLRVRYETAALSQGLVAVNSILRDWIKGQITAVECGMMSFEATFMPHMLLADGRQLIDAVQEHNLLPAPKDRAA